MRATLIIATFTMLLITSPTRALETLDIPLSVPERAGVDRVDNQVVGSIPLPEGDYKDAGVFGLYRADGTPEPAAQFVVRERWLKDDSIRFMTVHFRTDLKANEVARFVVKDRPPSTKRTASAVTVAAADGAVTVDTGVLKFTVKSGDWHLFDSVDAADVAALKGPGTVVFKAEYGRTPIGKTEKSSADNKDIATPPPLGQPTGATAVVRSITVEEKGPGRAVVLVRGAFRADGADKLDFQARYYAVAGCASVRVVFTVINRQGRAWDEFVGLRELGFVLPTALPGDKTFAMGSSEGTDHEGALAGAETVTQLQPSSIEYLVSGATKATGKCKELNTTRVGWMSLAGKDRAVTAAVRWFWQLHPKGLEAAGDGTLRVWLVPFQAKAADPPTKDYSEPLARVDLYTGGARTHEMLFAFHKPGGAADARARAMGTVSPLFAACDPAWYCQKTLAFDRICDARLENYPPAVRDLVRDYEFSVDASFCRFTAYQDGNAHKDIKVASCVKMPTTAGETFYVSAQKVEEYGFFNFGGHCEHKDFCVANDALNSRWDGNYYDVPRACLIRFLRTGMWQYFDAGQAAALHLADIDITHWNPGEPKLNGIERMCPNRGHFRQFWTGEKFGVSGNVDSAKSQSLYEFYNLTGDAWFLEAGLLSGDYLVVHGGSALRAQGNRITGLFMAYRSTRNAKYKNAWQQQAAGTAKGGIATGGTHGWDQYWMYGLANEGLYNYFRATGDLEAARGVHLSTEGLVYLDVNKQMGKRKRSEYDNLSGFTVACFGYAYELTGDAKYLQHGLSRLAIAASHSQGRSKSFAQHSRISPQFLYYLCNDYKAPKPVLGDKQSADPTEATINDWASKASTRPAGR